MPQINKPKSSTISLVYHTGGLGDFITTFPALGEWNRQDTQSRRVLLGKPSYGILGVHCGLFDEVLDVESAAFSWLYARETAIPLSIKAKLSAVRSALLFTAPDSPVLARFRQFGMHRLLFQDPFPRQCIHVSDYHLSLFGMGTGAARDLPALAPHPEFKSESDRLLDGIGTFVALHPGSGSARKNWPLERYLDLAEQLAERKVRIVWIMGPAERKVAARAQDRVVREASLPALVHIFSRCVFYVGNDSGISHLCRGRGRAQRRAVWAVRSGRVAARGRQRHRCFRTAGSVLPLPSVNLHSSRRVRKGVHECNSGFAGV